MPTLMYVPGSHVETTSNGSGSRVQGSIGDDRSTTATSMYNSDESTIFDDSHVPSETNNNEYSAGKSTTGVLRESKNPPIVREKHNKSVTFDESFVLLSTHKQSGRYSRRDTLNSDVSLLSCDDSHAREREISEEVSYKKYCNDSEKENHSALSGEKIDRVRQQHRHDEYIEKYQPYVKATISDFQSKFPEMFRDYRIMSVEEKAIERQKVFALLTRLGISKYNNVGSNSMVTAERPSVGDQSYFKSPVHKSRLIDETLSPLFSPNANEAGHGNLSHQPSPLRYDHDMDNEPCSAHLDRSRIQCEKSELLLSMNNEDLSGIGLEENLRNSVDNQDTSRNNGDGGISDFEVPINNDEDNVSSDGSMEVVRRAPVEETHYSEKRLSCMTPERTLSSNKASRKREATSSGKRGADMRRSRHSEQADDAGELCAPFGRLSISPSVSSPPKDLFITSQSPISPRLTYHSPGNDESDDYSDGNYRHRISLGRDSYEYRESSRRDSNIANDSLATYTPPKKYQSKKDKRRAFREAPVNVVLKKGATFHLEKIAVKRTEHISSKSGAPKGHRIKAPQRRRLINFPDPLVRYSSRRRRALKEMFSWVRRAENEFEEGRSIVPAVGAFFSLSEQQIIDVSLKLFLSDYAEKSQETEVHKNSQVASALEGKTLVVVRTKGDTAHWESALRESTGCAVLNHSSLPLSERIRGSTAEKACMYDIVLTTYDAMKSPDIAIPVTDTGHAITKKIESDGGWHSSRSVSQQEENLRQQTKKLSVLHRVRFKRIIFVDTLGRKCYLAKGGTARATASVALSSSSCRLVFFKETEADGSNAFLALRKSDKGAVQSVSSVLHLTDNASDSSLNSGNDSSDDEKGEDPLESIAMDFKDLIC